MSSATASTTQPRVRSYTAEEWSQEQAADAFINLQMPIARGQASHSRAESTNSVSKSANTQRLQPICSRVARFLPWTEFEDEVLAVFEDVKEPLKKLNDGNHPHAKCLFEEAIAELSNQDDFKLEQEVKQLTSLAVKSLCLIYEEMDAKTIFLKMEKSINVVEVQGMKLKRPVRANMDFAFVRTANGRSEIVPVAAIELKRPQRRLQFPEFISNETKELAGTYNAFFCGVKYVTEQVDSPSSESLGTERQGDPDLKEAIGATEKSEVEVRTGVLGPMWYLLMVTQAILYALETSSGCIALLTHNKALFLKVDPDMENINTKDVRWLKVHISKLYSCDARLDSERKLTWLHGILAMIRHAMKPQSDVSIDLRNALYQLQDREDTFEESADIPQTPSNIKRLRASNNHEGSTVRDTKKSRGEQNSEAVEDCSSEVTALRTTILEQPEVVATIMQNNVGVMANGGSGMVLCSSYEGVTVAVKCWNGETVFGLQCLKNEMEILEHLHGCVNCHEELGDVIPRIIAMRRSLEFDPILVTEYVGEEITVRYNYKNEPVSLSVGGVLVPIDQIEALQRAGQESLEILHRAGVTHGDIKLENVRARQEVNENGDVKWHVWLVDFGFASKTVRNLDREDDLRRMRDSLRMIGATGSGEANT